MRQKLITLNGSEVSVYQKGSHSKSIVFIHGNSLGAFSFMKQFDSDLANKYQLIAIDLPGHGKSPNARNPEDLYNIPSYVELVKGTIEHFNLENCVLVGHSLGGHVALDLIDDHASIKAALIFGTPPIGIPPNMAEAFLPNPHMAYAFQGELSEEEATILANEFASDYDIKSICKSILGTDPNARTHFAASIGQLKFKDEIQVAINTKKPIAILHGTKDGLVNKHYIEQLNVPTLWKTEIVSVDSGHSPQMENAPAFNEVLFEFCNSLS